MFHVLWQTVDQNGRDVTNNTKPNQYASVRTAQTVEAEFRTAVSRAELITQNANEVITYLFICMLLMTISLTVM